MDNRKQPNNIDQGYDTSYDNQGYSPYTNYDQYQSLEGPSLEPQYSACAYEDSTPNLNEDTQIQYCDCSTSNLASEEGIQYHNTNLTLN